MTHHDRAHLEADRLFGPCLIPGCPGSEEIQAELTPEASGLCALGTNWTRSSESGVGSRLMMMSRTDARQCPSGETPRP